MDFVYNICNCIGNSFIFDKLWWKETGLPIMDAIAIPLIVWWLSWLFGASRAEKQKELRELRNNLNLLLSISISTVHSLCMFRNNIIRHCEIAKKGIKSLTDADKRNLLITYDAIDEFDSINEANYAPCLKFDSNYLTNLLEIKKSLKVINSRICTRNDDVKRMGTCMTVSELNSLLDIFVWGEVENTDEYISQIEKTVLGIDYLITTTKKMEQKDTDLHLIPVTKDDEYQNFINELKRKYDIIIEYKSKEQENDK